MKTVSVAEARRNLAAVLDEAARQPIVIERRGKAAAVIVEVDQFQQICDAQDDLDDIAAFDSAMAEEGENLPWEQAKADLGWA
ncbi:MAG: type II toxin-antitoxin system Phd/YefM family antitoxin [Micrococcales bacterium]|nr:type II toxin-antitoxin system Phd/YefM family antitoxin [Micrococcales bacterium]